MNPERLLQLADDVQAAHNAERDRARHKIAKLDKKISAGHTNLAPLRARLAAAAGER